MSIFFSKAETTILREIMKGLMENPENGSGRRSRSPRSGAGQIKISWLV
jgi:hypothetical protein